MPKTLSLFFSTGIGLSNWKRRGLFDREVALYNELHRKGWTITFFTFDRSHNIPDPEPIRVVSQWPFAVPRRLNWIYELLLPFLRYHKGKSTDVIMTNQAYRGWPAIIASKIWGARVVARCGMVYGEQVQSSKDSGISVCCRRYLEKITLHNADLCIVPTSHLAKWVEKNYRIKSTNILIIPNYVDTESFRLPHSAACDSAKYYDLIAIGRLHKIKRHDLLLQAALGRGWRLIVVGQGELYDELRGYASQNKIDLELVPFAPNKDIPKFLHRSKVFILLSEFEGHPKALIEAMACGCACVGADSAGINNILEHEKTGLLVKPEVSDIREAVERLLNDPSLRQRLGYEARQYALRHYSLTRIAEEYSQTLEKLIRNQRT